jgi:hypothetical protein
VPIEVAVVFLDATRAVDLGVDGSSIVALALEPIRVFGFQAIPPPPPLLAFSRFNIRSDTFMSSPVWMLSPDESQYQPGMGKVIDWPLYSNAIGRTSRCIGAPVSGQAGASAIVFLPAIVFLFERDTSGLSREMT